MKHLLKTLFKSKKTNFITLIPKESELLYYIQKQQENGGLNVIERKPSKKVRATVIGK
jgi:hypothetical protein